MNLVQRNFDRQLSHTLFTFICVTEHFELLSEIMLSFGDKVARVILMLQSRVCNVTVTWVRKYNARKSSKYCI